MERFKLKVVTNVVFSACLLLFAISYFSEETVAFVCLVIACIGQAEALLISFIQHRSLNLRVLFIMLLILFMGRISYLAGVYNVASCLFLAVLLSGCFLVFRFVLYMNKYCNRDAEKYLDS